MMLFIFDIDGFLVDGVIWIEDNICNMFENFLYLGNNRIIYFLKDMVWGKKLN